MEHTAMHTNRIRRYGWAAAIASVLMASPLPGLAATADEAPVMGQKLSSAQVSALGRLPTYTLGKQTYRVLPPTPEARSRGLASRSSDATQQTQLLNQRNVVGTSYHQLVVRNASEAQIRDALGAGPARAVDMHGFEAAGMVIVQFDNFDQTVRAFEWLKAQLPDAVVSLPVQYQKPVPR